MTGFRTDGLELSQAPPLSIPAGFFLTAPVAVAAAGLLLARLGAPALATGWAPPTLALAHLGTLGFLTPVMWGALYQMTPVVAASPVRAVRSAHAVHALLVAGVAGLLVGLGTASGRAVLAALLPLGAAVLGFAGPVGLALLRAPTRTETVAGMRLAVASLLAAAGMGILMALGHGGLGFPGPRPLWLRVHLGVGLLGWVGGLIAAVSWQVVPMFYLAPPLARAGRRGTLGLVAVGVAVPLVVLAVDAAAGLSARAPSLVQHAAGLAALPAALAVWGLHPWATLRSVAHRRRRRAEPSLLFWRAGLGVAPLCLVSALAAHGSDDPRWGLLLGWLAVWGWAGMIVHGMLTRIVPFLVWFHRFSPLVGRVPVPSLRALFPDRWARQGFALHCAALLAGAGAILTRQDVLTRGTGLLLAATGAHLGWRLALTLRRRRDPV